MRERVPDRLLRLELPRMERPLLPRKGPDFTLAGALRDCLRDGRVERDLLPPAPTQGRAQLGGKGSRADPFRGQGQSLPNPQAPPASDGDRPEEALGAASAPTRGEEDGAGAVAIARELPSRGRDPPPRPRGTARH